MAVGTSQGVPTDDDQPPDDPWAAAAQPPGGPHVDDDEQERRPRRAWRRVDAREPPSGADGEYSDARDDGPHFSESWDNSNAWHSSKWESWQDPARWTDRYWSQPWGSSSWNRRWDRGDWGCDEWTTQTTSAATSVEQGPSAAPPVNGWARMTSEDTTRRTSSEHGGAGQWSSNLPGSNGLDNEKERRNGVSEKMNVPVFSAEDTGEKLGTSARSYIRQIEAWTQVTRAPKGQQALLLYQNLSGRAWIEAEELQVSELATEDGVERFKSWIIERYQEIEVGKIAEALNGFFKRLRRTQGQTIREFNAAFDRAYARL